MCQIILVDQMTNLMVQHHSCRSWEDLELVLYFLLLWGRVGLGRLKTYGIGAGGIRENEGDIPEGQGKQDPLKY